LQMQNDFNEVLKLLGRPVTYYPSIAQAFGEDVRCAIFLSNFRYWEGKQDDPEGWIYKSQADIKKETGLNRYAQEQSRKTLKELLILEEKLIGRPPIMHYRFNWSKMNEVLNNHFEGKKPEKVKQDPLLFTMMESYCAYFEKEIGFEYEKMGKDWGSLKKLSEYFKKRIENRKKKEVPENEKPDITNQEICDSWNHFLMILPKRWKTNKLALTILYSDVNLIIAELQNEQRINKNQPTAHDYV
jgi:hypothetical protein